MKNRQELAKYFAELGFKTGVEVGVYKGGYSIDLCLANPELKLYCVDIWGINDQLSSEKNKRIHQKIYKYAKWKLARHNTVLIRDFSINAAKQFDDNSLDFVYIDSNHAYNEVSQDIAGWTGKIRPGGIVSGHDYDWVDVKKAVDEFILKHNYKLYTTEDENCSWWFIK
ncbi:MAG: hypothetical protein A3H79_00895 [Candidatus Levybacteria bacterium RIFCSPLOWO2_02_FULL_36_8b]|nr:MAG: hypothetical protein A3H79_00895 [Candidatus Levybacteria bacterium RIFCSPLOWO2_02_FULL_36_8b]